jgi:alpha-ketoglutarate-dependent taurine dioxygenase
MAAIRRRELRPGGNHVSDGLAVAGKSLPYMYDASGSSVDLADWVTSRGAELSERLHAHGALLFRGFSGVDREAFSNFVRLVSGEPLEYTERSSPRTDTGRRIYTSTEQPADQTIFLHNEQSYALDWPMRLFFFCEHAPAEGGATPVADSRRILSRIPTDIRERLAVREYRYVRNFRRGLGLSWPEAYGTDDPAEVERYCSGQSTNCEWRTDGSLTTSQIRPVIRWHPVTGEETWFNHLTFFNVGTLNQDTQKALLSVMSESELPNNTYYGDGESIEPEVLHALRSAYVSESVSVPWQAGDIMMIDNMLASHGRESFTPPRRVLVAMTEPWSSVRDQSSALR